MVAKLKKGKKKKFDYYDAFERQAAYAVKEAKLLQEVVNEFKTAEDIQGYLDRAHAIEHEADLVCHDVIEALLPDFVTPIDREDIIDLIENLDEVTDKIEEVIQLFYMYDIHFMHDDSKVFADMILRSCDALNSAMADFRNCKKSSKFRQLIVDVNNIEDEADDLYIKVIRGLFTVDREKAVRVYVWTRIFEVMEDCVDQCETVANKMNSIMVKYA